MKITSKDVADSIYSLMLHAGRDDIPSIVEYRLAYLAEQVNPISKAYNKAKQRLLRDNALRAKDGGFAWLNGVEGSYQIEPDKLDAFEAAVDELDAVEHEIAWHPMPIKHLENKKGSIPGGALTIIGMRPFLDATDMQRELDKLMAEEAGNKPGE